ncbi:MAG: TolC family outer membrane protein [Hyphomicrobium sp.]
MLKLFRLGFGMTMLVLAFAGLSGVTPARAESLNEALASAYQYNPRLDAERARLRATDEDVARAMSGYRPRVDGSADINYQNINTRPITTTEGVAHPKNYAVSAEQNVFNGFQTVNAVKGAEAGVRAGREQLRFVEQSVLLEAVTAYMNTVRDQEIVRLSESNVGFLTTELKATQDRFAVGEVTRTDVAQSQARRAGAIGELDVAQANLKASRASYEQIIGHPPAVLTEPVGYAASLPRSLDEASSIATKENPSVVAALYVEEQARYGVDQIRGELLPEVTVSATYNNTLDANPFLEQQERTTVTGRVTMPIYEGGETYARVRQAKHTHISKLQEIEQNRTEVQSRVVAAWSQLQAARAQLESDKVQVESNQVALAGVREEERVGQRTLVDVLDQQRALVISQIQLAATKRNIVVNSFTVLERIGRLEMTQLGLTSPVYDPVVHADEVRRKWFGLSITHDDGRLEHVDVWNGNVPAK